MEILKLREHSELASEAAEWFHSKWDIPVEEYAGSIQECLTGKSIVPQWYVAVENQQIIGGIGVIENDFHNRKDLTPNVCAVYVEENYRCQGIAGKLLEYVCEDMRSFGLETLYPVSYTHLWSAPAGGGKIRRCGQTAPANLRWRMLTAGRTSIPDSSVCPCAPNPSCPGR